jgi:putative ABC transport system permease protein
MNLAWLMLRRQPVRTALAVLGVAAIAALLFDMLLLSRGLVLSFRDLLERAGFDVRVLATEAPAFAGPAIAESGSTTRTISALAEVEGVLQLRLREVDIVDPVPPSSSSPVPGDADADPSHEGRSVNLVAVDPPARANWTIVSGRNLPGESGNSPALLVNRRVAARFRVGPGSSVAISGRCADVQSSPPMTFTVAGIADFPFDDAEATTVGVAMGALPLLCREERGDRADILLVRSASASGADAAASAIRARFPRLYVVTNEDLVERFSRVEFSYFRQLSVVLATVTLFFGFLLIAVLLTVSVNQRLGEVAALRALGLSRVRVLSGVLFESGVLVAAGGVLAVPLGLALSMYLDTILRRMPGVPADLHFFVFEPRVLLLHAALLILTAVAAALYPMRIVAVLPIAATLRREVVS